MNYWSNLRTKPVTIGLSFIVLVIAVLFFYTWFSIRDYIYVHTRLPETTPASVGLNFTDHHFYTQDDLFLASWYVPVENPKAVVILVHGFNETGKAEFIPYAKFLHDNGYASFLVDLRSFGGSKGQKVTLGIQEWKDVEAAYKFVRSELVDESIPVGFLGKSMGAATVVITAGKTGLGDFVIVEAPYADFEFLFTRKLKERGSSQLFIPFINLAIRLEFGFDYRKYEPIKFASSISVPLLAIGGERDIKVKPEDAEAIYNAATGPKEHWFAPASHNVFIDIPEEYQERVVNFLNEYVASEF